MLQVLSRNEIDTKQWDDFIARTPQRTVYATSWFLDLIPQEWGAVVETDEQRSFKAVMPFQFLKKYGLKKVDQNPFAKELGVYHLPHANPEGLIKLFLHTFPFISRYYFNTSNQFGVLCGEGQNTVVHHLTLNKPYKALAAGYSTNRRRNIVKAKGHALQIDEDGDIDELISMFRENVAGKIYGIQPGQLEVINIIYASLKRRRIGVIYCVRNNVGEPLSMALLIHSYQRLIYYFAASNDEGRRTNAQTLLLDHVIKQYAESETVLDFEGGGTPGLDQFYSSFGARAMKITYLRRMKGGRLLAIRNKLLGIKGIERL